jgi:hypothetical protein
MFCEGCGVAVSPGASFCAQCGRPLATGGPPPNAAVGPSQPTVTAQTAWHEPTSPSLGSGGSPFPAPRTPGSSFSTAAFIAGGIAILFLPIVFGPAGIVLGAVGASRGERLAVASMIVALTGMIIGFAFGVMMAGV